MRKTKILATATLALAGIVTCVAFAACGGGETSNPAGSEESAIKTYTLNFNAVEDLADHGENPLTFQVNGGTAGAGIIALDNWGSKKFKTDDDGEIAGTGLKYTFTLTVEENAYTMTLDAHAVGNNASGGYKGEGNIIYTWTGTATASGSTYTLAAPTAATFAVTGTLAADDPTAMTSFVPDAPYSMSSTETKTAGSGRVNSAYLKYIMYGTTVTVSGSSITTFASSAYYTDWAV